MWNGFRSSQSPTAFHFPLWANCGPLATVIHIPVLSRLVIYNVLYLGLPLKSTWEVQLVQNAADRLLTGVDLRDCITLILFHLHWNPNNIWVQFKFLILALNTIYDFGLVCHAKHSLPTNGRPGTQGSGRLATCNDMSSLPGRPGRLITPLWESMISRDLISLSDVLSKWHHIISQTLILKNLPVPLWVSKGNES